MANSISPENRPGLKRLANYKGPKRGPFAKAPNRHVSKSMRRAAKRLNARQDDWSATIGTKTAQSANSITILAGSGGKLTFRKPGSNK